MTVYQRKRIRCPVNDVLIAASCPAPGEDAHDRHQRKDEDGEADDDDADPQLGMLKKKSCCVCIELAPSTTCTIPRLFGGATLTVRGRCTSSGGQAMPRPIVVLNGGSGPHARVTCVDTL